MSADARRILLLGDPVAHSLSPRFQQRALDHLRLSIRYEARRVSAAELAAQMTRLGGDPLVVGANVTVPHKQAVMSWLDAIDPTAAAIGAVNTLARRDGRLCGFNTDAEGFKAALADAGFPSDAQAALVLGAGGGARAVVFALKGRVRSLWVAARRVEKAQLLCESLGLPATGAISLASAPAVAQAADLIVNATPVGMDGISLPLPAQCLRPAQLVFDLVYAPAMTPFLRQAAERGARAVNGLRMLLHQGAAAFTLWTDRSAPVEVMWSALREAAAAEAVHA